MEAYERYEMLMTDWASEYIRPFVSKKKKEEIPEQFRVFFTKLFFGFTEISSAVEALKLGEVLISLAPPRSTQINRDEYLKYHINAYLQEVYILKERLKSYITKLKRVYSKTKQKNRFDKQTSPLFKFVKVSFEDVVNTRSDHVHSYRYSDDHLDRLSSLTLISRYKEDFIDDAKLKFKWVQRTWKQRVKENNKQTMKLLDIYFDRLYEAVTKDGRVVVPNNALQRTHNQHINR